MISVKDQLSRLLDHLGAAALAEPVVLKTRAVRADTLHQAALEYGKVDRLPLIFSYPLPADFPFQPLPNAAIYQDPAAMLYNELVSAWDLSLAARVSGGAPGDDLAATIRPNWGTVLVASVLGGFAQQSDDNTPWIRRNDARPITLEQIADADPEVASTGWVPRVLETYEAYGQLLSLYPELASALWLTLPDLQGPLDTVEQLLGADLFIDMMERPELCQKAFTRAAEIQLACARLFAPYVQDGPSGYIHQHGFLVRGGVLIRCDSAVMISSSLYRDLVAPADELVLAGLGGGGVHSCGKIDHAAPAILELPSIRSFDFGQSFMNDVDSLYSLARQRSIPFLRVQAGRQELESGTIMDRFPTGVSLRCSVETQEEALRLFDCYQEACAKKKVLDKIGINP